MRIVLLLPLGFLLSGCLAQTALDVVTLPVRVVSAGVDALTTSQSEADERRGRELREAEERAGREARRRAREQRRRARAGQPTEPTEEPERSQALQHTDS